MSIAEVGQRERGSIPLALLVIIVVSAFVGVVMARSIAEQRATRFDNEYVTALHAAEVGLEEALFRLNNGLVTGNTDEGSATVDTYAVEWDLEQQADTLWVATSVSEGPNGVSREVLAEIRDEPIFEVALATQVGVDFAGGNTADSYNSSDQSRCSLWESPSTDCYGIVASNGQIDMGSVGSNFADRVRVHDWGDPGNQQNRCLPTNSIYCQAPIRRNIDPPLDILSRVDFAQELVDACDGNWETWHASDHSTGSGGSAVADFHYDPNNDGEAFVGPDGESLRLQCFDDLRFDVRNINLHADVDADNPLIVVVKESLFIGAHVELNCDGCRSGGYETDVRNGNALLPAARALQFFTLAQDVGGPAVEIRQQSKIGAAIYAPHASCGRHSGSNAQVEIYGSIICQDVLNQGGWEFHYDEDLLQGLTTEKYIIARWEER